MNPCAALIQTCGKHGKNGAATPVCSSHLKFIWPVTPIKSLSPPCYNAGENHSRAEFRANASAGQSLPKSIEHLVAPFV